MSDLKLACLECGVTCTLWLQVLILSYETFRLHEERFRGDNVCDLLICDEAHRLKNDQTLTNKVCIGCPWHHAQVWG